MITSRLTSKAQTTIPQAVRHALGVKEGDELAYVIEPDRVMLMRASPALREDPFTSFQEWDSEADREAYRTL